MHRGRNRSRKPVESSQNVSQLASSSTVTSLKVGVNNGGTANTTSNASTVFPSLPLLAFGGGLNSSANQAHFSEDHIPFGIPSKDYR